MKVLYQEGAVSLNDYDQAKVQLQSAQSAYTTAADAYGNTRVTSPIDGYVTSLNVSVGSMLSPGAPVASVANVSDLIINATVSEYLVGHLRKDDLVEIRISTLGEQTYQGKVTAISPAPAKGTLTYPVKFSVVNPDGIIKAGMFAEILITSDQREDVLAVPSDAVIVKNGESMVVILEKDIPSYRKITTGLDDGTLVEVTSGLSEGETIVVEGHQFVTENVKVKISE
jgi:RND family efflux transporter MFP subunit